MKSKAIGEQPHSATLLSFRDKFASSDRFAQLYREGMKLVEDTAEYLDRDGRAESRALVPPASLAYQAESIKLTTRLTQIASWLLVRRAIAMGEITAAEAHTHRHRVSLAPQSAMRPNGFEALPASFRHLIAESHRLYNRILRLERLMSEGYSAIEETASPLSPHIERIRLAFPAA
jgi:regulator of CtrA degradation